MIKAIFIDIDGTLLNSKREIITNTKVAIEKCIKKGIKVILASGRSRAITLEYQQLAGASPYIISSNGADVYDIEKDIEIYSTPLDKETVNKIFNFSQQNSYKLNINYNFELVMNKMFYPDEKDNVKTEEEIYNIIEKEKIVQCVVANKDIEKMIEFKQYLKKNLFGVKIENESKRLKDFSLEQKGYYFCDVINLETSKGRAVKKLCEYLELENNEIIAMGDGENDVSMFEITDNSVAMENATAEVKKKANYITDSNDEDGVAKVLKKFQTQRSGLTKFA